MFKNERKAVGRRYRLTSYTRRLYYSKTRSIHWHRMSLVLSLLRSRPEILTGRTILELGCSDLFFLALASECRLIPNEYTGIDVFWEDAEEPARTNACILRQRHPMALRLVNQTADLELPSQQFDTVVALETIEHVDSEAIVIEKVSRCVRPGGHFLISVPVEIGPVAVLKEAVRALLTRTSSYSFYELSSALFGKLDGVRRITGDHKGFDFRTTRNHLLQNSFLPISEQFYPGSKWPWAYGYIGLWVRE